MSYGWSEKGRQLKISLSQRKKERKTIFGAVNPRTGDLFTQVSDRGNTVSFFNFCVQCVRENVGKKVYLLLDNVKFYHAKRLETVDKFNEWKQNTKKENMRTIGNLFENIY